MYRLLRAADRAASAMEGVQSRHCFSFGDHYDPSNTHHGVLLASNTEIIAADRGFDTHPHRAVEIVTWVLGGALVHQDSEGHAGVIYPGLAQRMSAGTGILHSERNDSLTSHATGGSAVSFVQMWLRPDDPAAAPSYQQREVSDELVGGRLTAVASGDPKRDAAIRIGAAGATMHVARLTAGQTVELPDAAFGHLYVAAGSMRVDEVGTVSEGDSLRITAGGAVATATRDAELLYWEMSSGLTGP